MEEPTNIFNLRPRTQARPLDLSDFKLELTESKTAIIITQISTGSRAFVTAEDEMDFKNDHRPVWLPSRVRAHARTLMREANRPPPDFDYDEYYNDYAYDPSAVI